MFVFVTVTKSLGFAKYPIRKFFNFKTGIMARLNGVRENRQTLNVNCRRTIWPTTLLRIPTDCFGSQDSKKVRH